MKGQVQCINDEILEKMSLKNRYNFLNNNLINILKPESFDFLKQAQDFYLQFENKYNITHNEDFYDWFPEIGKKGLITRAKAIIRNILALFVTIIVVIVVKMVFALVGH